MVVDGKMYDPNTQSIKAEGYVDLNQIPDQNEGEKYEGDTAACTSWTTAGNCVYGTEANNAQLNEINKTHAGPEFEEVDEEVPTALTWQWTESVSTPGIVASQVAFKLVEVGGNSVESISMAEYTRLTGISVHASIFNGDV